MKNIRTAVTTASLLVAAALLEAPGTAEARAAAPIAVDPGLPAYQQVPGVVGNLTSIGSDTLTNMMTLWAEGFQDRYPGVNVQVQGAGSSTAPPALAEGTASLGPMSRAMKQGELRAFEDRHGYPPARVAVAIDMLTLYVHRDNPIEGLTLPQVDAIFSSTRRCGFPRDITRWGQLGLGGGWINRDLALYSRNAASGTYGHFKAQALCDGDFKPSINEQPGSASVVQGVSESLNGIGYTGIGYVTSGVRTVPIAEEAGLPFAAPTFENAVRGDYPLVRFLYVYVNRHPARGLPPLEAAFLRWMLSREGQEVVVRDGYVPLPAVVAERQRRALGLE